jgi:hypothetical protein
MRIDRRINTGSEHADRSREAAVVTAPIEEPLPLIVAPDWEVWYRKACRLARLIDRHLDREERRRLLVREPLTPVALCLELRVSLISDLLSMIRRCLRRAG